MRTNQANILASAARTANGNQAFTVPLGAKVRILLSITAISGAGATLTLTVEAKLESGAYAQVGEFTAKTAIGSDSVLIDVVSDDCRLVWTIVGTTPSVTFESDKIELVTE